MLLFSSIQNLAVNPEIGTRSDITIRVNDGRVLENNDENVFYPKEISPDLETQTNNFGSAADFPEEGSDGDYYWMKLLNSGTSESVESIIEVSTGGYLLCAVASVYNWVIRIDENGNHLWNMTYDTQTENYPNNVIETSDGCFVIVGYSYNYTSMVYDAFALKIDANGDHMWNKTYGGSKTDKGNDIVETEDGGLFIFGNSMSYGSAVEDFWLLRLDFNGNAMWNKTYGDASGRDYGNAILKSSAGDYILAGGRWSGSTDMGDVWLIWVDSEGVVQDDYLYPLRAGLSEGANDIIECANGDFVVTGYCYDSSTNYGDAITMRTDASGAHLWNSTYRLSNQSNGANSVIEMSSGGLVICGDSWFGSPYGSDAFICRYNDEGELLWNQTYRGGWSDYLYDLVEHESGGFLFAGETNGFGAVGNDGWLGLVPEPKWIDAPGEIECELDISSCYDIGATSAAGIDTWYVNDTAFQLDDNGLLTHSTSYLATYPIFIWFNDTMGNSISKEIDITFVDSIAPTWVVVPEDTVIEYGESFVCDLDATDKSGISRFWLEETPWFTIDPAGIIRTRDTLPLGPYGIKVCVNDSNGNAASTIFIVTIEDTTAPTWVYAPHHIYVEYGEPVEFHLEAEDPFGISSWVLSDTENFTISETGCIVSNEILEVGTYGLEVTVTDGNDNSVSESFNIIIRDTTCPNWLEEPLDQVLEYGQSLEYDIPIWDLSGVCDCEIDDEHNFDIELNENGDEDIITITNQVELEVGTYELLITVSDKYDNSLSTKIHVFVISIGPESSSDTATSTNTSTGGDIAPVDPLVLGVAVSGGGIAAAVIIFILYKKYRST